MDSSGLGLEEVTDNGFCKMRGIFGLAEQLVASQEGVYFQFGWFIMWVVEWFVVWLVGRFLAWLIGWVVEWWVGWFVGFLFG